MHDSKASSALSWVLWAGAEVLLARLCSKELEERTQDGTLGVGGQGLGADGERTGRSDLRGGELSAGCAGARPGRGGLAVCIPSSSPAPLQEPGGP